MPISLSDLRGMTPGQEPGKSLLKFDEVPRGKEFHRIFHLPRREIPADSSETRELARFLTEKLARHKNPEPGPLRLVQALALKEAWENKGGVGAIPVGNGKMLLSFLLPEVWQAPRPLILTKASMVADTERERMRLSRHWHIRAPGGCPILSYEMLSTPQSGEQLDDKGKVARKSRLEMIAPTHIVMDEAHALKNSASAGAKRVEQYLRKHPETVVWAMTGTLFKKSITDAAHILRWALKDRAPLPDDFVERELWASALDARNDSGFSARAGFGALVDLLAPERQARFEDMEYETQLDWIRDAVAQRIYETPGVLAMRPESVPHRLEIAEWAPAKDCPHTEDLFRTVRGAGEEGSDERAKYPGWQLPDGTQIADGIAMARQASNAGLGYYQVWRPDPPAEWRFARNAWAKWCRKAIQHNRKGIDSEARMKDAVRREIVSDAWQADELPLHLAHLAGSSRLANWEREEQAERKRTGFREPPSVSVWVSWQVVEEAHRWLQHVGVGLIWVHGIGLGETLEKYLRLPYYGAGGVSGDGRHIMQHIPGSSAIASIKANGTGKNIQHLWHNNLWLTAPDEQALGRTHRPGQKAEVVGNWIYLGCPEHLRSFFAARDVKAKFAERMNRSPQKLLYAESDLSGGSIVGREGRRWSLDLADRDF